MFPELNDFLNLNVQKLANDLTITVLESGNADASFVLNHFMSLYLKSDHGVCLVSLAQSFTHYSCISNKLGINLTKCRESGQFAMVEGLKLFGGDIGNCSETQTSYCPNVDCSPEELRNCLKNLYIEISRMYANLAEKSGHTKPSLLLVDDLSILITLGFSVREVSVFLQYLDALVHRDHVAEPADRCSGSFVAGIHLDLLAADQEIEQLFRQMAYRSDMVCYVTPLKTGYCRDVQGELVAEFRRRGAPNGGPQGIVKQGTSSMHYKVKDKTLSLFPPGTSSAVL